MPESKSGALPLGDIPFLKFYGVSDGARTHDSQIHNLVLYQLNYTHHKLLVRLKGIEPLAHDLEGRCSILLS